MPKNMYGEKVFKMHIPLSDVKKRKRHYQTAHVRKYVKGGKVRMTGSRHVGQSWIDGCMRPSFFAYFNIFFERF
jgi:hypothetical protein